VGGLSRTRWLARALWLIAILALGNIAMSGYMLLSLWRLPADAPIERLLLRHEA
jgi:preprotein translocase subunit SecG